MVGGPVCSAFTAYIRGLAMSPASPGRRYYAAQRCAAVAQRGSAPRLRSATPSIGWRPSCGKVFV